MSESWRLKRTTQCAKCPWRVDVDPYQIPNGYSVEKHKGLADTIANPGDICELRNPRPVMACHETQDAHCLGWLMHQLGPGNNIALRIKMMSCENGDAIKLIGEQHERFADTLPLEAREEF